MAKNIPAKALFRQQYFTKIVHKKFFHSMKYVWKIMGGMPKNNVSFFYFKTKLTFPNVTRIYVEKYILVWN